LDREFLRGRNGNTVVVPGQRRVVRRATEIDLVPLPSESR